jgi:hypothetical protein
MCFTHQRISDSSNAGTISVSLTLTVYVHIDKVSCAKIRWKICILA